MRIRELVRSQRLNPTDLQFANFIVASSDSDVIAVAQMRQHRDGSRELGSILVLPAWRGQGIAARLVDALVAAEIGSIYMITGQAYLRHYARWGFQPIDPSTVPAPIRFNYLMGRLGGVISVIMGRPVNRLTILKRPARGA